jgi:hypothetical protein
MIIREDDSGKFARGIIVHQVYKFASSEVAEHTVEDEKYWQILAPSGKKKQKIIVTSGKSGNFASRLLSRDSKEPHFQCVDSASFVRRDHGL